MCILNLIASSKGTHHQPVDAMHILGCFSHNLPNSIQAHLRGVAIEIEDNPRVFDLTTCAGFVRLDWHY